MSRVSLSATWRVAPPLVTLTLASAAWAPLPDAARLALCALAMLPALYALHTAHTTSHAPLGWIALWAVLARLALVDAAPLLSDDLYRYVWDGRVALSGVNPFSHAPSSDALAALRDAHIWPLINHPEIPTIYPPLAQALFVMVAALGGALSATKLALICAEVVGVAAVGWLMRARWTRRQRAIALTLYGLHPLVIIEVAWSGHVDALAWSLLAIALASHASSPTHTTARAARTGAMLGLSVAAKLLGLVLLPLLALAPGMRARARVALVTACLGVAALSYAPYADAGGALWSGFSTYAARWRANDALFRVHHDSAKALMDHLASPQQRVAPGDATSEAMISLSRWDDAFIARGWTRQWQGRTIADTSFTSGQLAQHLAKLIGAGLMGLWLLWLLLIWRDPIAAAPALLLALYAVAPTVHPWYVAWLVPLVALSLTRAEGARWRTSALLLSATCLIAYSAWWRGRHGGPWAVPHWLIALEYLPPLLPILLYDRAPRAHASPPALTPPIEP